MCQRRGSSIVGAVETQRPEEDSMTSISTLSHTTTRSHLRTGAGITAAAALFFPRVNAVIYDDEKIWQLDPEARVLAPLVVIVALGIFAAVGPWAWRGGANRPARAGLVVGVLALVGVLAYWISLPIMLGGLAVTLGVEGLRRGDEGHRGRAQAAVALGAVAALGGALFWLLGV
jgi:hypothetical protein